MADTVRRTLGPRGRAVVLDKSYGSPVITLDGVTIAKDIELEDRVENLGAELIKEVASKTNDAAGDGTTTATVLAQTFIREGLKAIAAGLDPVRLKYGMEQAREKAVATLQEFSKPIKSKEEVAQVATISARDSAIGDLIADVIYKVGKDGVVTVEQSQTLGLSKEIVEGLQFDRGYISPYMITNPERMEAILEEPHLLVTDKKIAALADILPILEKLVQQGKKELVIIADEVEGEALATLVVNKIRGIFTVLAVKAPGFGDRRKELLQDIAAVTGADYISEDVGRKLEAVQISSLGQARRVIANKDNTTIVGGKGERKLIEDRIAQIKTQLVKTDSEFDREKLEERLGKLAGGVAVIKVGAATEVEQKEKQHRIEDAVSATKAAIAEGIVPGGGVALVRVAQKISEELSKEGDEAVGAKIILEGLYEPLRQIAENAGHNGSVILNEVLRGKEDYGFNAQTGKFEPLVAAGIIDPTKVTRSALENAASIAALILITEAVVAELPEKKDKLSSPTPPGGMEDY